MLEEREIQELVELTKNFLYFTEKMYSNKEISDHEYEVLTCKKIAFLKEIETKAINYNDIACGLEYSVV